MPDQDEAYDIIFYQLAFSLHTAAMQQMGKTISPFTGKIERNLEMAKGSIDMLEMIQRKTKGNLTDEENKMLDHFLFDLRMNYVEEVKRGDAPAEPEPADSKSGDTAEQAETAPPKDESPDPASDDK